MCYLNKLTLQVLGTVRYQAPEVLRGEAGGSHSDVFSLGVTTWHLLTRTLPYDGLHPHIVIYQVRPRDRSDLYIDELF